MVRRVGPATAQAHHLRKLVGRRGLIAAGPTLHSLSMFLFGTGPSDINGANVFRRAVEFLDKTLFGDATNMNVHPTEEQS